MTTAPTTISGPRRHAVTEQERLLEAMSDDLRKDAVRIRGMQADMANQAIRAYYEIGGMVRGWEMDPSRFGAGAEQRVAPAIGVEATTLQKAKQFHTKISEDELQQFLDFRMRSGGSLYWSHIIVLLSIETKKERTAWLARIKNEDLSSDALRRLVMDNRGGSLHPTGGRKLVQPKTLQEGVRNLKDHVADLQKREQHVWHAMFEKLDPQTLDAEAEAQIAEARQAYTELEKLAKAAAQACEGLLKKRPKKK